MTHHPSERSQSGGLMPALLFFGGLTLVLMATFIARPTQHTYADMELTATAEVVAANLAATASAEQVIAMAATATHEAQIALPTATTETVVSVVLDPAMVSAGESSFQSVCSACHGFNAQGISGLGKPLVDSAFIDGLSDDELLTFLQVGRDVSDPLNTTGVPMPARGGNPGLTDDDLREIIAYIRSLNLPSGESVVIAPTVTPSGPTPTPIVFVPLSLASGDSSTTVEPTSVPSLFVSAGEEGYVRGCSGCHGLDGNGLPYLAPDLSESQLLSDKDGMGLLNFLTQAHPPVNPEFAYPHPYRGGYPELTDAQIQDIIIYLYSLPGAGS
jgi:mono/diheme cytochrome c family protein